MANEDVIHTGPMHGILLISTASTAQGWVFENELPTISAYCGYKIPSGEYVYDETVHKYPIIAVEDKGDLISAGNWSTRYATWSKIGYNPDSGTGEEVLNYIGGSPVWAATSGGPMSVVSANNNDNAAGSGTRQVWVKYLGPDYLEYSTIVTMNGTTAVVLVDTSIIRIQNFQSYTGAAAAGNITIYRSSGGSLSQIGTGLTRARNIMWTVPANKTLYIKTAQYSAGDTGDVTLITTTPVGRCQQIPLAAGDNGILQIVRVRGLTATSGTFNVMILRPLWFGRVYTANGGDVHDLLRTGMPQIFDNSALYTLVYADATAVGLPLITMQVAVG